MAKPSFKALGGTALIYALAQGEKLVCDQMGVPDLTAAIGKPKAAAVKAAIYAQAEQNFDDAFRAAYPSDLTPMRFEEVMGRSMKSQDTDLSTMRAYGAVIAQNTGLDATVATGLLLKQKEPMQQAFADIKRQVEDYRERQEEGDREDHAAHQAWRKGRGGKGGGHGGIGG